MGDWVDQQYTVLLTELWKPAAYGDLGICWLWTVNKVPRLYAFILAVTLRNKLCSTFHLIAFSSLQKCKYYFHFLQAAKLEQENFFNAFFLLLLFLYSLLQAYVLKSVYFFCDHCRFSMKLDSIGAGNGLIPSDPNWHNVFCETLAINYHRKAFTDKYVLHPFRLGKANLHAWVKMSLVCRPNKQTFFTFALKLPFITRPFNLKWKPAGWFLPV